MCVRLPCVHVCAWCTHVWASASKRAQACVLAFVRACVRACVCVCVCACLCLRVCVKEHVHICKVILIAHRDGDGAVTQDDLLIRRLCHLVVD